MSYRRSRFKVTANIPARRRPGAAALADSQENGVKQEIKKEFEDNVSPTPPVGDTVKENIQDPPIIVDQTGADTIETDSTPENISTEKGSLPSTSSATITKENYVPEKHLSGTVQEAPVREEGSPAAIPFKANGTVTLFPSATNTPVINHNISTPENPPPSASTVTSTKENHALPGGTATPQSKPFYKRARAPVFLPPKKQRRVVQNEQPTNDTGSCSESNSERLETPNVSAVSFEDTNIDCGKENASPMSAPKPVPEEAVEKESRLETQVSHVFPASPVKSPVRVRFAKPLVLDNIRRQSTHLSSASESEDDGKRTAGATPRVRNTSECSSAVVTPKSPVVGAEVQAANESDSDFSRLATNSKRKKPMMSQFVRKIAEARREFNKKFDKKKPDRSSLKMFDLIFYNPSTNPFVRTDPNVTSDWKTNIKPDQTVDTNDRDKEKEIEEEIVDDPMEEGPDADAAGEDEETEEPCVPVPQVKIGINGEIILDEKSLVIETTEAKKGREALMNTVPVYEDNQFRKVSYYKRKTPKGKDWTDFETKLFYKALNSVGTDFALMQQLFPTRIRAELKNKFKREERYNQQLLYKAQSEPSSFNLNTLKETFERERKLFEEEKIKREEERRQMALEKKVKKVSPSPLPVIDRLIEKINLESGTVKAKGPRPRRRVTRKIFHDFVDPNDLMMELGGEENEDVFYRAKMPDLPIQPEAIPFDNTKNIANNITDNVPNSGPRVVTDTETLRILNSKLNNGNQANIRLQAPRVGDDFKIDQERLNEKLNQSGTVKLKGSKSKRCVTRRIFHDFVDPNGLKQLERQEEEEAIPFDNIKNIADHVPDSEPRVVTDTEMLMILSSKLNNGNQANIRLQVPKVGDDFKIILKDAATNKNVEFKVIPSKQNAVENMSGFRALDGNAKNNFAESLKRKILTGMASVGNCATLPNLVAAPVDMPIQGNHIVSVPPRQNFVEIKNENIGKDCERRIFVALPPAETVTQPQNMSVKPDAMRQTFIKPPQMFIADAQGPNKRHIIKLNPAVEPIRPCLITVPRGHNIVQNVIGDIHEQGNMNVSEYRVIPSEDEGLVDSIKENFPSPVRCSEGVPDEWDSDGRSSVIRFAPSRYEHDYSLPPRMGFDSSVVSDCDQEFGDATIVHTFQPNADSTVVNDDDDTIGTSGLPVKRELGIAVKTEKLTATDLYGGYDDLDNSELVTDQMNEEEALPESLNGDLNAMEEQEASPESPRKGFDDEDDVKGFMEDFDANDEDVESNGVLPDGNVQNRNTEGFQYTVIKGDDTENKTYLTNLQKGSFVFMAAANPGRPSEQKCTMYMIDEVCTQRGSELRPVPVHVPPELMRMIVRDVND